MAEPHLVLRASGAGDDAACGRITGLAAGGAPMAARVPFARQHLADTRPLPVPGRQERIVAELDGRVAGFAQFDPKDRFLWYLFVDPTLQGAGVGSTLLAAVEGRTGHPLGLRTLAVNDLGLRFYLRRGFRVRDGWVEEDWHGGTVVWIVLEKRLARPGRLGRFG